MDAALGRRVLGAIEDDAAFDMDQWVQGRIPGQQLITRHTCGTRACLAGWALLEAGYAYDTHYQVWIAPDGGRMANPVFVEARMLLRLTDGEYHGDGEAELFFDDSPEPAVRQRFRALVEAAERKARGG
jgi:hypothetical protein